MSELNIQLSTKQHEILLRGLRYVRSSVALHPVDWSEDVERQRQSEYREIAEIEALLNGATINEAASL